MSFDRNSTTADVLQGVDLNWAPVSNILKQHKVAIDPNLLR